MSHEDAALQRPATLGELFRVFMSMALQGFGGVLPVAQRMLVDRQRWLSQPQFVELLALSQVLPGPNIVNLALIAGDRWFGWRGAVSALAGLMLAPLLVVLLLAAAAAHAQAHPRVAGALQGMGVVAAGLIAGTALRMLAGLRGNALGQPLCLLLAALALLAVGVLRWPLVWTLAGLGSAAVLLAWWRVDARPGPGPAP